MNMGRLLDAFKEHSGTICAVAAVAGVFVTAYFSSKAALEAKERVKPEMETKEKAKEYAKVYAKTAVSAAATSALIIGSDRIHVGKELAIAGVAAMWKEQYVSLDKKVINEVGVEKAAEIHENIIKDKIKEHKPQNMAVPGDKILVFEPYTEQYIVTTRERIAWAMLRANERLQKDFEVKLNFIIGMLGGKKTIEGDRIGWNMELEAQDYAWGYYGGPWIEMFTDVQEHGGKEALCLFYQVDPEELIPENMIYSEEYGSK